MNPVACESSTTTVAPWRSASSQMPGNGAIVPSIENTPSVTTRRERAPAASRSRDSSWPRSPLS